ncbi:MAG: hypothetical protein ACI89L_000294 [Phycisphaerales bacterium]|jgi:hypothetical protein
MSDAHNALASGLPGMDGTTSLWDDIAGMETAELVRRFRFSVGHFDPRVFEMGDEMLDRAWLPEAGVGRWPIRVLLGHLADSELVWAARVRKAVAEPGSVLALWDEHAPIDSGLYSPPSEDPEHPTSPNGAPPAIGAFVASLYTIRQWVGEWLGSLDEAAWALRALHPERGELSVRAIVELMTWHVEHHAGYLNLKVEKLIGPRPVEDSCDHEGGGGCGKTDCACEASGQGVADTSAGG